MLTTDEKEHQNEGETHQRQRTKHNICGMDIGTWTVTIYPMSQHLHTSTDATQRVPQAPKHPRHTPKH